MTFQEKPPDDFSDFEDFFPPESEPWSAPESAPVAEIARVFGTGFQFLKVSDLEYRPPEFLIDGLVETDCLALIFGEPGCGKSFAAVDLAMCVSTGTDFHDLAVKSGPVLFIAGEGHNGLQRRFAAWSKARDVPLSKANIFLSKSAGQFLNADSAKAVAQAADEVAEHAGIPVLIVVDTVARNYGPGDENSTLDMSMFVAAMDDLRARYSGCTVLLIHHSGHADKNRGRGSIVLKGALDAEYRLEKKGRNVRLINTKMKDAEPPADMAFTLTTVRLEGEAASAVLSYAPDLDRDDTAELTPAQRLGIDSYVAAAANAENWHDGIFRGVRLEAWRAEFYSRHTGDGQEAKRKAFLRVRSSLTNCGKMEVRDDVYETTCTDTQDLINGNQIMSGAKND